MATKTKTYLKTGRLKVGLTQTDIAALLGIAPDRMSRLESGELIPHLDEVLCLEVIYESRADILMGAYTKAVYARLGKRVSDRLAGLEKKPSANQQKTRLTVLTHLNRLLS